MKSYTEKLYVGWYDPSKRFWYPVGQICSIESGYRFEYLRGAAEAKAEARFRGIFQFPDFHQIYESKELFAFFRNRLLTSSRDNYTEEVTRLGLDPCPEALRPFDVLSRTNGRRVTDTFEVYSPPKVSENTVELVFFTRGVRYLPDSLKRRWEDGAPPRQPLHLQWQADNAFDEHALRILDADDEPLGFVPRYYSASFHQLLERGCDIQLELSLHNRHPGFVRERFLIKLVAPLFEGWHFPQSALYDPIADEHAHIAIVA